MKITYLRLENVAGIYVGMNRHILEIDFTKSKNRLICIAGRNTAGKSVLLSSLTPFATVTSLDERSTLSYIIKGKNGYKEIRYQDGDDEYIIKHYYKTNNKDGHSVKSYFMKNGEELNENGNVTSFISLVEIHFNLTQEMMRLVRLGSNVSSFITLTPAKRKEYIGGLIDEIDIYLAIHKEVNDQMKVVKTLISANNTNLYNCHIPDVTVEEDNLKKLSKDIKHHEKERDTLISKISKIQSLMSDNDINDLKRKQHDAESSLAELKHNELLIKDMGLENSSVDELMKKRSAISDKKLDTQSKINSYRLSIDSALKSIERLELSVKKISSNNDLQSLMDTIELLKDQIRNTSPIVKGFNPLPSSSDDIRMIMSKLLSFNQLGQMIYSLGNRPLDIYLKLKTDKKSVDKFLDNQMKHSLNRINDNELKMLISQVMANDDIVFPTCTDFDECPYFRLYDTVNQVRSKLEDESYDDETLRYIQMISNNIDNILNEVDKINSISIPDSVREVLTEKSILYQLSHRYQLFPLEGLQAYLAVLSEYEIYKNSVKRLSEYEYQLSIYKKSGIDNQLDEIKQLQGNILFYQNNIKVLTDSINNINADLESIDNQISVLMKYNDGKKYEKVLQSTLESTNKILVPLETASSQKIELEFSLRDITNRIELLRSTYKEKDSRIAEYNRLIKEGKELAKQYKDISVILDVVSTKKGIPVIYMKQYLGRIRKLTNTLLKLVYDDRMQLANFNVTQDSFEIPYIKNGTLVPDVKYGSQSEVSFITMALSFALSDQLSGNYNILLLDEVDAGLDQYNRDEFLNMLTMQMNTLNSEQVFMISHNISQIGSIPMDIIKLSDIDGIPSSQNIIWDYNNAT